jgi:hypothetical protein
MKIVSTKDTKNHEGIPPPSCFFVSFVDVSRFLVRVTVCVMLSVPSVWAQCAMCRVSIANSDDPGRVGGTLNAAILTLLIPTLVLIGAFVALVLRYHRADMELNRSEDA